MGRKSRLKAERRAKPRPTISLCMIVKDEEAFLEDCLRSVAGAVDEICIVDTGSTDRTVEIAERYGAKIGYFEWADDFAAARKASLDMATGDWILVLDADERLAPGSAAEIRRLVSAADAPAYGVIVRSATKTGEITSYSTRLFPAGLRYKGALHEEPKATVYRAVESVEIQHLGYTEAMNVGRDKFHRNYEIAEKAHLADPEDPKWLLHMAAGLVLAGELETGVKRAKEAMAKSSFAARGAEHWGIYRVAFIGLMKAGEYGEALALAERGLAEMPGLAELMLCRGNALLVLGHHGPALREFQSVLSGGLRRFNSTTDEWLLKTAERGRQACLAAQGLPQMSSR